MIYFRRFVVPDEADEQKERSMYIKDEQCKMYKNCKGLKCMYKDFIVHNNVVRLTVQLCTIKHINI